MRTEDYQFISQVLHKSSGLALGDGKEYLVESRLSPLAASMGLTDVDGLVRSLRSTTDGTIVRILCEAMTTNESLFFRDGSPFEALKDVVFPALAKARQATRKIRIWSAAASTGQEPYSIAMTRELHAPVLAEWTVEILATDLSNGVLERARKGIYNQFEVQRGLPIAQLVKFFTQIPEGWQIIEKLRRQVSFQQLNLLDSFGTLGVFDVIFCRNVLIYFDQPTKAAVLARLTRALAPDGYLFLGGAETVLGICDDLVRVDGVKSAVYRRR
jgi:chemotaxis protein methyltransferase CheR